MEYVLGNSKRIKSKGNTSEVICPNCKKAVNLAIFTNLDARLSSKSLVELNTIYFLLCPECIALYTVEEEIGKAIAKGSPVNADDLQQLRVFGEQN